METRAIQLRTHQKNIDHYQGLLKTKLNETERQYLDAAGHRAPGVSVEFGESMKRGSYPMTKTQLLRLIGTGKYDSEIPSDYLTSRMLFECMADGLVEASYVKNDDLFWLTERGKSACQIDGESRDAA
jgi:hypothetical protein